MGREDIIRQFHADNEPHDPETGRIFTPGSDEHLKYNEFVRLEKNSRDIGEPDELIKQINEVVSAIKNMKIEAAFAGNVEQEELLEKKKDHARKKINYVLKNIEEYILSIKDLDKLKQDKESMSKQEFNDKQTLAENFRGLKHDALINDLHSAIKFIAFNFGKISDAALEKWQEEQEKNGLPTLFVERKKFPKQVLCPDNLNIRDRKQITAWAYQVYYSLSKIK